LMCLFSSSNLFSSGSSILTCTYCVTISDCFSFR
jgi:hypothetical protein